MSIGVTEVNNSVNEEKNDDTYKSKTVPGGGGPKGTYTPERD